MDEKLSRKRHIAKTVTWRIIASGTTFVVAYLMGVKVEVAGTIALVESAVKMVLYYYHERAWFRFGDLGRK